MSAFFLFILAIIIIIFYFGLSIIRFILNTLFGLGGRIPSQENRSGGQSQRSGYGNNGSQYNTGTHSASNSEKRHRKVFDREDGEYVDFEEVE